LTLFLITVFYEYYDKIHLFGSSVHNFVLVSCSNDDGGSPATGSETVRLTVNVSNTYNTNLYHNVLVGFGGADATGKRLN